MNGWAIAVYTVHRTLSHRKQQAQICATAWMTLQGTSLRVRRWTRKAVFCLDFTFMTVFTKQNRNRNEISGCQWLGKGRQLSAEGFERTRQSDENVLREIVPHMNLNLKWMDCTVCKLSLLKMVIFFCKSLHALDGSAFLLYMWSMKTSWQVEGLTVSQDTQKLQEDVHVWETESVSQCQQQGLTRLFVLCFTRCRQRILLHLLSLFLLLLPL